MFLHSLVWLFLFNLAYNATTLTAHTPTATGTNAIALNNSISKMYEAHLDVEAINKELFLRVRFLNKI